MGKELWEMTVAEREQALAAASVREFAEGVAARTREQSEEDAAREGKEGK